MESSYIAFHETDGIYLGIDPIRYCPVFSTSDMVYTSKAVRFDSKSDIDRFFLNEEIKSIPVKTAVTGSYVDVIDIIKSGHTKHTENMIDKIPMTNKNTH